MSQTVVIPQHHINWELTMENIRRGKSILFLGPEIYRRPNQPAIDETLAQFLKVATPNHSYIRSYYQQDGLFLLKAKYFKSNLLYDLRRFFAQDFSDTLAAFRKLSLIPFNIIVNLTPDNRLSQIFNEVGVEHQFHFYNKNEPPSPLKFAPHEQPVIYNLLGYLEEDNSVVLTHDDWHDYLKSVHRGESMDAEMREALVSAHQYCFLGLSYHKWYMQLLLRVLSIHLKEMSYERIAMEWEMQNPYLQLYHEQFDMQFVATDFVAFVEELYHRCEQQNLLRQIKLTTPAQTNPASYNLEDVFKEIGQGDTGKALDILMAYVEARKEQNLDLYTQMLLLKGRYTKWERDSAANLMTQENKNIEFAQINFALVQLTTEAKKLL